jgi:type IV secretion system protein VirB2
VHSRCARAVVLRCLALAGLCGAPAVVWGQTSPFDTGATSLVDFMLGLGRPIAIVGIFIVAIAAWARQLSLGGVFLGLVVIAVLFGAPQIVDWIRSLFGV